VARQYDSQLIESVGVRRRRLRDAVLFGADRGRHSMDEYLGKVFTGVILAAVICACCVGFVFIKRELDKENAKQQPAPAVSTAPVSPSPSK